MRGCEAAKLPPVSHAQLHSCIWTSTQSFETRLVSRIPATNPCVRKHRARKLALIQHVRTTMSGSTWFSADRTRHTDALCNTRTTRCGIRWVATLLAYDPAGFCVSIVSLTPAWKVSHCAPRLQQRQTGSHNTARMRGKIP